MDGSSRFFIEALEKAGLQEQDAEVEEYVVKNIISYKYLIHFSDLLFESWTIESTCINTADGIRKPATNT